MLKPFELKSAYTWLWVIPATLIILTMIPLALLTIVLTVAIRLPRYSFVFLNWLLEQCSKPLEEEYGFTLYTIDSKDYN